MNAFLEISELKKWGSVALLCLGLGLSGCGGGSGGSSEGSINEQAVTISDETGAEESSVAARQSARQAIIENESSADGLPFGVEVSGASLRSKVIDFSQLSVLQQVTPEAYTSEFEGECGGSFDVTVDDSNYDSGTVIYNNYCMPVGSSAENAVINGRVDINFESDDFNRYTANFDYTITYLGETTRFRGTESCNENGCTAQTDFTADGRSYRSEGVVVTSTANGYSVRGRVYDGDRGYLDYEASGLVLCQSGGFQSGSISITDSTGEVVVEVTFSGCDSYTVTFDGVARTVSY